MRRSNFLYYLSLLFLFLFLNCNIVKALECAYKEINDKVDSISTNIVMQNDSTYQEKITVGSNNSYDYVYYGNVDANIKLNGYKVNAFMNKDSEDFYDATMYIEDNGDMCPPYFYVMRDPQSYFLYGYFSDKAIFSEVYSLENYIYAFESIAPKIEDDDIENEDGNIVVDTSSNRYSCSLDAIGPKKFNLIVEIDYDNKNITFSNGVFEEKEDYISNFDYSTTDVCPTDLKVCYNSYIDDSQTIFKLAQEDDNYYEEHTNFSCYSLYKADDVTVGSNYCKNFFDYQNKYHDAQTSSQKNLIVNELKNYCRSVLAMQNYNDYKYSCTNLCTNMDNYFDGLSFENNDCTFSDRLLSWVANIVRWGKYLVPVVVIVLSILDFIKAVGADKEDEMKKAQKRFVVRLIAAALIFILPFIIEFVLTRFGFNYNGCGIIDL